MRARALGIPLQGDPGPYNAITDVPGVEVGYTTLISGEGPLAEGQGPVRTGVTAIHPRGRKGTADPVQAGWFSFNGNGEMTGTTLIEETGFLSTPILITNTHSVGAAHSGAIRWLTAKHPSLAKLWALPVVAETWDGYLNDTNGLHVTPEHAYEALEGAHGGPIEEGSVGGGTGMICYGFKGGSGTASRRIRFGDSEYTVGVFMQANFGWRPELTIAGVPIGIHLRENDPLDDVSWLAPPGAGSCITIVATDAPLLPGQCKALARRVPLGLARTGTTSSHFSGDIFLAFSTGNPGSVTSGPATLLGQPAARESQQWIPWGECDSLYAAVVFAVEEAVLNVLVANTDMVGCGGRRVPALPHERVCGLMSAHRVTLA
ncbi:MAG: aminopeptidase [Actinobacteria bacterium RBG_16_64_13]|nr:MAG: aminopeptidase [Actinobacteria bacterium RBG_16_64_13]